MRIQRGMNTGGASARSILLGVIAAAFLVMAGCAHEKAYKRADRLSREGQYEQAVAEYENAIRLAEDKNNDKAADKYRARLAQVKLEAGQFYYREAQIRLNRAELGEAQGFIERAIGFCPQDQTYEALRGRIVQAIAEAEKVRAEALSLAEQREWQSAVQRMNEALAMYRTLPGGDADLKRIKDRAYRYYLDRAGQRLQEGNLAEAESEAQAALVYQDGSEAKTILRTVKDRREAAVLIENGRKLLEQGRAEEALAALERAAKLHPSHPEVSGLLSRAKQAVCDGWLAQGRTAAEARDYPLAMRLFQKSQGLLDGYGGVAVSLADVRAKLGGLHLEASRQYLQDGLAGIAAFHAAAALNYLPGSVDAQRQFGQSCEEVRQDVSYTIAFTGFKSAPQQQSLGAILDAAALEHLTKAHPANVMIVERTDLQAILGEQDLSKTDRIDPESRVATGQLQGVDALILGQVLDSKVISDSKQTGYGESTYQDGYRREPNPDYVHASEELDHAMGRLEQSRRNLAQAEERLARMHHPGPPPSPEEMDRRRRTEAEVGEARRQMMRAASEVGESKMRLASIPPEVLVPNMVVHRYPIETFTWTARVICMVKMLDTATGEVLIAERVEGQAEHSDRMVQGDAFRNVPEDALELPSESTLIEGAANSAIAKLRQTLNEACSKHGQRFLVQMQRAQAAGDALEAVDNSVKYLFAYPGGDPQAGVMIECIRAYLADEDGLIDVRALLRDYCHVLP